MKLWSPIKTIFDKGCWDVLGFAVLVPFPREAGLDHRGGKHETANPNHQKLNTRSGFDENKLPTMGSNTRLRHFLRKVEEMVMKLWSLIGQCLARDTSLRDFGVISLGGNIGTLHFRPRIANPNKNGSSQVWSPTLQA